MGDLPKMDLERLFTVAHVEVVQQISANDLELVIRQLMESVDCLQAAPKAQNLQNSIEALSAELEDLRSSHSNSLQLLDRQQVTVQTMASTASPAHIPFWISEQ